MIEMIEKDKTKMLLGTFAKQIELATEHLEKENRKEKEDKKENQLFAYELASASAEYFIAKNAQQNYVSQEKCGKLEQAMLDFFLAESFHRFRASLTAQAGKLNISTQTIQQLYENKIQEAVHSGLSDECIELIADSALGASYGERLIREDELILQESFRKFGKETILPLAERIHRENTLVPDSLLQGLSELGSFGINIPGEYGGYMDDFGKKGMMIVTEELSRYSLALGGSMIVRPEILVTALLQGGTQAQKGKWLPKLASGEIMNSIAVTEPDFGSDVAGITLEATEVSQPKKGWVLNGVKTWCTFAQVSDILLVLARSEPEKKLRHRGLTLFLAEKPRFREDRFAHKQAHGGEMTGAAIPTIGYRGMHSFELNFENYFVPAENMIGERGQGFYLQMAGFSQGRLQTAARAIGVMQGALEAAVNYAGHRLVFGKSIDQYAINRWKIARMSTWTQLMRQYVHFLADCEATAEKEGAGSKGVDALPYSTFIKFYAAKFSEWVTREAQQIHGGMGYAEEFPVSRYFLDARVLSIFEGVEEVLAIKVCARALLEANQRKQLPSILS